MRLEHLADQSTQPEVAGCKGVTQALLQYWQSPLCGKVATSAKKQKKVEKGRKMSLEMGSVEGLLVSRES